MDFSTQPANLPDLTLVDGDIAVQHSRKARDPRLLSAESAMISGLCSVLKQSSEQNESEEAAIKSMLHKFGFGPMFTVI